MSWYHIPGNEQDIVIGSRVQLARNLMKVPFPLRMDAAKARSVITEVGGILTKNGFSQLDFSDMSRTAAYAMAERQYVTTAFMRESLPHALFLNEPCNLAATVCVEDHIRLCSMLSGLSLRDGYAGVIQIESILDEAFFFAFDEKIGYLTASPERAGCGLEASVLLCLPLLESEGRLGRIAAQPERNGYTIRALCRAGHGGSFYRLRATHHRTSGQSEEEILAGLESAALRFVAFERQAREEIRGTARERLKDRVLRAEGLLRAAHLLTAPEAAGLLTDVRLGAAMGLLPSIRVEATTVALMDSLPASMALKENDGTLESEREILRARLIRERLFSA